MRTTSTAPIFASICLTLLLAIPVRLQAGTLSVTSVADSGPGTLRQALADSNPGDTVDATGLAGTITLTSGQLSVPHDVSIVGPGPAVLTVSGNAASRVFEVSGPGATISGLTIANGYTTLDGGAIKISSSPGSVVVFEECVIADSNTWLDGGGIYNSVGVRLNVYECLIAGNSAVGAGGGIANHNGSLTVAYSTIRSNVAIVGNGGAILNEGTSPSADLHLIRSTLNGNAASYGGAIYSVSGAAGDAAVGIENSTVSGNASGTALVSDGAWGGTAQMWILFSTIGAADTGGSSGVIRNEGRFGGTALLTIGDSILRAGPSGLTIDNASGLVDSLGFNLASDDGGGLLTHMTDLIDTDPLLGPLQDNGGPTFTHALLPGSPAIDAGSRDVIGVSLGPDQRNMARTYDNPGIANATWGDGTDIGAFEATPHMEVLKERIKLSFAKPDADSFCLSALLDLGSGFDPAGKEVGLDVGGAAAVLMLDEKGRASTVRGGLPAGKVKLALKAKTGLWAFSATFSRGSWQGPWAARGLVNGDVPKPGQTVTVPTIVQVGNQSFVDLHDMVYTARVGKVGAAK